MPNATALTIVCLLQAAAQYSLPAPVMWGLLATEAGSVGLARQNKNGSYDLGPLQINDATWLKPVAQLHFNGNEDKARTELQYNGCFNATISAWIFSGYLKEANGDYVKAVGFYNSHNPEHAARYKTAFAIHLRRLYHAELAHPPPATLGRTQ